MKFLLGKKIEMSQIFKEDGSVVPVTLVQAGPVMVTTLKNKEKDGYESVQIAYGNVKKLNKPRTGHLKNNGNFRTLKELKISTEGINIGDSYDVSIFNEGDAVKVSGISKGKGFQGAVKRHGFKGMPASHGHHHVMRHVGSIGQRFPQHTLKGTRMAGHMGAVRVTTRGLQVVKIDKANNILAIKGAIPGRRGSLIEVVGI